MLTLLCWKAKSKTSRQVFYIVNIMHTNSTCTILALLISDAKLSVNLPTIDSMDNFLTLLIVPKKTNSITIISLSIISH